MPTDRENRWMAMVEDYQRQYRAWERQGARIVSLYSQEQRRKTSARETGGTGTFPVLASNVATLRPALFSSEPVVVVERRHRDRDPVGRVAAEVLSRAANQEVEGSNLARAMSQVVLDVLLPGRGVPWVRYAADPAPPEQVIDPVTGEVSEVPRTTNQRTVVDYVHYRDFAHAPDRNWSDVMRSGWVARRVALSRREGRARFGSRFDKVDLSLPTRTSRGDRTDIAGTADSDREARYGEVWEIWSVRERKQVFTARGLRGKDAVLEERDDPYGLRDFFPCPRPAYASLTNNDLIPTPDFERYADLAAELDRVSGRIISLTRALKLVGVYDSSAPGLAQLLQSRDGQMIPVQGGALTQGGVASVVSYLPMQEVANTLLSLYQAREQAKQALYEVSGVSDIIRGQVDPREKASQSDLKASFASQRLDQRRREVEHCARDTVRIQVEMIAELFPPERLREQSGFDLLDEVQSLDPPTREQLWQEVMKLVRDDKMRSFRVDVETASTVALDEQQAKESRNEFLGAVGGFLNNALPVMAESPDLAPAIAEALSFTVRGYRAGRGLESAFEEAVSKIKQRAEQAEQQAQEQPEQSDPAAEAEAARVQQQMQIEGAKGQAAVQKAQADLQIAQQKAQADLAKAQAEVARAQAALEAQRQQAAADQERAAVDVESAQVQLDAQEDRAETDAQKADLDVDIKRQQLKNAKRKPKGTSDGSS